MRKTQREKKQTVRNSRTEKHEEYGSEIHTEIRIQKAYGYDDKFNLYP